MLLSRAGSANGNNRGFWPRPLSNRAVSSFYPRAHMAHDGQDCWLRPSSPLPSVAFAGISHSLFSSQGFSKQEQTSPDGTREDARQDAKQPRAPREKRPCSSAAALPLGALGSLASWRVHFSSRLPSCLRGCILGFEQLARSTFSSRECRGGGGAVYEKCPALPNFGFWLRNRGDILSNCPANPHVQRVESKFGTLGRRRCRSST